MTNPVFFTVEGDYRAFTTDVAGDGNYEPENIAISATVTFTPLIDGVVRATASTPRPVGYLAAPITAIIDPADGRLKVRSAGEAGNPGGYTFTPVRLLANSLLELDPATPLFYRVTFTNVTFGTPAVRGTIASFDFEAPSTDVTVNLVELAPQTGVVANGLTKIAPGGVRVDGSNIRFTFGGVDIPDPIPTSVFTGATGPTGAAATISVGTVTTGAAGSTAAVTNSGTSGAAVLDFAIPTGATGAVGATGTAATIAVGTVTTGAAGSTASVVNSGTSGAAVFDMSIPRGNTGDVGATGPTGAAATIEIGTVSTGAPGSTAAVTNIGSAGAAIFNLTIPAGATGAVGATGPAGPTGSAATVAIGTVTTGGAGSAASVTNVGTSTAAVFDITIPKGDTGSADPSTWDTLDGRPAVVAAGSTKAAARSAIDAAYTGDVGQPNGIASLDSAGKVPVSMLPNSVMTFEGLVDVAGNSPALSDFTGNAGQVYRVSVGGTRNYGSGNITANVGDYLIHSGSVWQVADGTDAISSVNGYTGVVTLTKSDVGLSAVDNTADTDKPISSATATALGGKEPTIAAGSTGQYYRGDKAWATLDKNAVGLSNVDNTTDLGKPISTATQTALDGKEPTISAGTSGQYWTGSKTWAALDKTAVGLGNVDNTADSAKNVLSASKLTTARTIDGISFDGSANVTVIAAGTTAATSKATPVDGDELPLVDSAASNVLKKLTWSNLKAALKTYFDSVSTSLTNKDLTSATNSFPTFNQNTTGNAATATNLVASTTSVVQLGTIELGNASDTTLSRSAAGTLAVEGVDLVKTTDSRLTNSRTPTAAGQVADLSIVAFGANTARATGTGDFPFGVKLQRAVTLTSVTYRAATADASGNLVVELRKNGVAVSGSSATIAAASQVAGGTATGTWSFAAGDIVTVQITGVGTTPGKGLIADITGVTA